MPLTEQVRHMLHKWFLPSWLTNFWEAALCTPSTTASTLCVIDFHIHTRGGHFGPWLTWFTEQFATRFTRVVVLTPDPKLTKSLFYGTPKGPPTNVTFATLPKRLRKRFTLRTLRSVPECNTRFLHAFIMWGHDLIGLAEAIRDTDVPWAAFGGMSWVFRGHKGSAAEAEQRLLQIAQASRSFRGLLQADPYITHLCPHAIWVPDQENVALPTSQELIGRVTAIRDFRQSRFTVGCFGLLTGDRCINEALRLAIANPDTAFVFAGKFLSETVDSKLLSKAHSGGITNVLVLPGFIADDAELNAVINSVDAIFIDGAHYPVQSTIVCRALHFGKCIVTPHSCSWTSDLVAERAVGIAYTAEQPALTPLWETWMQAGGPSKSRLASAATRDSYALARCFDLITARLTQKRGPFGSDQCGRPEVD